MNILISNDDGYHSEGIATLVEHLSKIADVTVFAPDRNRSGASNSLTLETPLRVRQDSRGFYSVSGTPTDCVHLALTGLLETAPDLVVSGINHGANLGDDVLYSGTVAAAMEGRFLGLPAVAVSLVGDTHFATAARVTCELVQRLHTAPLPADTMLNVNVPDLPYAELQGIESTRLGNRHQSEDVIADVDPRQHPIYWIGPAGAEQDCGEGTDFHAIRHGKVAVTPIKVDLTRHDLLPALGKWLSE